MHVKGEKNLKLAQTFKQTLPTRAIQSIYHVDRSSGCVSQDDITFTIGGK